jgi:HlyD family secretion protein
LLRLLRGSDTFLPENNAARNIAYLQTHSGPPAPKRGSGILGAGFLTEERMANQSSSRSYRVIVWTAAALVVVLVFYLAHLATRTVLPVRAYTVVVGPISSTVSTNGKIQPVSNFEAHAPFPGLINGLFVHEGDFVPQGKLLLTMDDDDARTHLAQALAQLAGARANQKALAQGGTPEERYSFAGQLDQARSEVTAAQASLTTLQALQQKGAAAPSEVSQANGRLTTDKSNLQVLEQRQGARMHSTGMAQAEAQVAEAQAGVTAAEDSIRKSNVRAPFAGTVYSLSASRTEFVQQGDRLLQMADLDHLQVMAYFDEPDIGKLRLGQPVTITWVAQPDKVWHGAIVRLPSTIITYTTRNVGEVLCSLDATHAGLLPDTNVDVTVTTRSVDNTLFVPREALHTEQGLTYVYKIVNSSLKRIPVSVGGTLNLTQIQLDSGIKPGDVVALGTPTGQPLINGTSVRIQ